MIIARNSITVSKERDIDAVWRFYKIAASSVTVNAPTEAEGKAYVSSRTVPSGWSISEPAYDGTSTNSLYTCDLTSFSDGSVSWSAVSKSSSYEAAKQAYNEAQNAKGIAENIENYFWSDDNGVHVASEAETATAARNVILNSLGMLFRKGANVLLGILTGTSPSVVIYDGLGNADTNKVAVFSGDGVRLGKEGKSRMYQDEYSIKLVDKNENEFFYVGDLRGSSGSANMVEYFTGDGTTTEFSVHFLSVTPTQFSQVTVDGSNVAFTCSQYKYTLQSAPAKGAEVKISYYTSSENAKAFTFGNRASNSVKGALSFAHGKNVSAIGTYSHAEGSDTEATGGVSHAEGQETHAQAIGSHAEGYITYAKGSHSHAEGEGSKAYGENSHAEGEFTDARGRNAHSEGLYTDADGDCSHASGEGTVAEYDHQTAIGRYNKTGSSMSDKALIIGNGNDAYSRSNAFTVDWDGNIEAQGAIAAGGYPSGLYTEKVTIIDGLTVAHANYATTSKSVAKTGFTPIGIVGMHLENATSGGTYNTYCFTHSFYLSGSTAHFTIRNVHASTDAKIKINAVILYAKS